MAGKCALVRVDFNVPLDKGTGAIVDDSRIRGALPTIDYLRDHGARVVLASHLGRPDGKVNEKLRLVPVAVRLQELLGAPVAYASDCVGPDAEAAVASLPESGVLLLENLRFHPEEEANDPTFARSLAALADLYVDDSFGAAHRAHASTAGVAQYLPAVAGLLMERELQFFDRVTTDPERPYVAIIGGAKVSDKIGVLRRFLELVDKLLIGGGMANTFLRARGYTMGNSLVEEDQLGAAKEIMRAAESGGKVLLLPTDLAIAERFDARAGRTVVELHPERPEAVPAGWMALDIGPGTAQQFSQALEGSRTIVWNGPMGVFELPNFALGTMMLADAVARTGATSVVGGGETVAAVHAAHVADRITHISTGGGASLEFLEGKQLPGVVALLDK